MNRQVSSLALLTVFLAVSACAPEAEEQAPPPETPARAAAGDTVWMILNHVRPDQRQNFERFVEEVLEPALEEAASEDPLYRNLLEKGRILYPTEPNDDSTFTYVYMLERYISGDYTYRRLLGNVYAAEQVEEYLRIPQEALDRPQESYLVIQRP